MSSNRRPWYPWYPKDFVVDEKVQSLSDDAELLYRRALDVMWQANALQLPNHCLKLANILARNWSQERFESAWSEIQFKGFELFKVTEDELWIYSKRLRIEAEKIENIQKKRSEAGILGGKTRPKQMPSKCQANAKQTISHTDTDTYKEKESTKKKFQPPTLQDVKSFFLEKGYRQDAAERAFEYYNTAQWKDSSGKQVKNWKQKMLAVWMKDENKATDQKPIVLKSARDEYEEQQRKIMEAIS